MTSLKAAQDAARQLVQQEAAVIDMGTGNGSPTRGFKALDAVPESLRDVPEAVMKSCPVDKLLRQVTYMKIPSWASPPAPNRVGSLYLSVEKAGRQLTPLMIDRFPIYMFGQSPSTCDYTMLHESVSRVHCAVVHHREGTSFLIDLNSTHGVRVGGQKIVRGTYVLLHAGDTIQLGFSTRMLTFCTTPYRRGAAGGGGSAAEESDGGGRAAKRSRSPQRSENSGPEKGAEVAAASSRPTVIEVAHILLKHQGLKQPVSKAPRNKGELVTRTLADAVALAKAIRESLTQIFEERRGTGVTMVECFAELAEQVSECSTAGKGGRIGEVKAGEFLPEFEEAAFGLEIGEVSSAVVTPLGVHLITRLA